MSDTVHTSFAFFLAFVTISLRALPDGSFAMVTEAVLTLCIFKWVLTAARDMVVWEG
jgi:hypothetical protein